MRSNDKLEPDSEPQLAKRTHSQELRTLAGRSCGPQIPHESELLRPTRNRAEEPATSARVAVFRQGAAAGCRRLRRRVVRHTRFCDPHSGDSLRRDATSARVAVFRQGTAAARRRLRRRTVRHTRFCDPHSGGSLRRDATSRRELRAFAAESCGQPIPRGIDPAPCDNIRKPAAGSAIESYRTRQASRLAENAPLPAPILHFSFLIFHKKTSFPFPGRRFSPESGIPTVSIPSISKQRRRSSAHWRGEAPASRR